MLIIVCVAVVGIGDGKSLLGLGLVTVILYGGLVGILKGIDNGNVIWFGFNYNSNYNCNSRGGWSIGIWIGNGNSIRFGINNGVFVT